MPAKKYEFSLPDHPIDYGVELKVDELSIEPLAQRMVVSPTRVERMATNFIPGAVGTLVCSQRDNGVKNLCDGAHRWTVLKELGIEKVMCEVHHGLTLTEEAMLFLIKNKESLAVKPIDMYKVGITAAIPVYVDTEAVLAAHDLMVGNTSANQIGAVNGVVKITEDYGQPVLDRVLTVAEGAWGRTSDTWDGALLGGLGQFIGRHAEQVSDSVLITKLGKSGAAWKFKGMVMAEAGTAYIGGGGRVSAAYALIKARYNAGRKTASRVL